jgi:hypothetical protein
VSKTCLAATYILTTTTKRDLGTEMAWVQDHVRSRLLVDRAHPITSDPVNRWPTKKIRVRLLLDEDTTEAQIEAFLLSLESVVRIERTEEWTPYMVGRNYVRGEFMLRGY